MKNITPKNPQNAVGAILSKAEKLPANLVIDATNDFAISFLLTLTSENLNKLKEESEKKDGFRALYLQFFAKEQGSLKVPETFDEKNFDLSKVKDIIISGDTADYLKYKNMPALQYLSVVFEY